MGAGIKIRNIKVMGRTVNFKDDFFVDQIVNRKNIFNEYLLFYLFNGRFIH